MVPKQYTNMMRRMSIRGAILGTTTSLGVMGLAGLAQAATVPNLQQDGFSQVLASQTIKPGQSATVSANGISVAIPANAFSTTDPVTFTLLGTPNGSSLVPSGTTPIAGFAFKVVDQTTGSLIGKFLLPVKLSVTSSAVGASSEYWNVSPTGAFALNPIAPTISGTTLTHAIAVAAVGWVVANPQTPPNFAQNGFPTVSASTNFTPGQAASLSANGISVSIPADTFNIPVTFKMLTGPLNNFTAHAPRAQTPVTDFAFQVTDTATNSLVGTFNAPVVASITNSQIGPNSLYEDISTNGSYSANPIAPSIQGDVMHHPIKAATVGWVITSPSVPAATSPVTGLPIAPVVAGGAAAFAGGIWLWRGPRLKGK